MRGVSIAFIHGYYIYENKFWVSLHWLQTMTCVHVQRLPDCTAPRKVPQGLRADYTRSANVSLTTSNTYSSSWILLHQLHPSINLPEESTRVQ